MGTAREPDADTQCMLAVRAGRPGAFEELVNRFAPMLFQFFVRQTNRHDVAEDLTQDVFLRIYRNRESWQPQARLRHWVLTIATNLLLNRRRREALLEWLPIDGGTESNDAMAPCTDEPGPVSQLQRRELQDAVRQAVTALPANQRLAVDLLRFGGLCYAEIAAAMQLQLPALKSLLHRAKTTLRRTLARQIDDHLDLGQPTSDARGRRPEELQHETRRPRT